jgi:pimeloyl-ACP methyl ester carboxylesterase
VAERLEIEGVTLAYEDTGGEGPTVVFVHGLGGSAYGWWAQLAACRGRGYRGIAYDQRGSGLSEKPGRYSVELWAEDLERLLDGLEVGRAALVGHSVGCMVAEHAAIRLGERIWALALLGGALEWRPEAGPVFGQRVELARAGRMDEIAEAVAATGLSERCRGEQPAVHGLMLGLIASNDPDGYAESAAATGRASMRDPEHVGCPVLAFAGAEDPVTPPDFSRAIAEAVPRGEWAEVEDAAHWCMLERPEAVNDALFGFLDRVGEES